MWIDQGNVVSRITRGTDEEFSWLHNFLILPEKTSAFGGREKQITLYDLRTQSFPAGLTPLVQREARRAGYDADIRDKRTPPCKPDRKVDLDWLFDHQLEALAEVIEHGRGIIKAPTGCHRVGTLVRMYDGSTQPVESVRVGDLLMGPDSAARRVLALHRGAEEMLRVSPVKGDPWFANPGHILTLVRTDTGEVKDVSIQEWCGWSKTQKHLFKLFRVLVDYPTQVHEVSPYFLGVLLGDGALTAGVAVVAADEAIQNECRTQAKQWGTQLIEEKTGMGCPLFRLTVPKGSGSNPLRDALTRLGVMGKNAGNKRIPREYMVDSHHNRAELLAGLIDTDGSLSGNGFDYISKSEGLARDVAELARSLGFAAYVRSCIKRSQLGTAGTYWRVSISGELDFVRCRVPRKQATTRLQKKSVLRTGFSVEKVSDYEAHFGFTLDGDGRYLLEDFTVTHNSGKGELVCAIAAVFPVRVAVVVDNKSLITDLVERLGRRLGEPIGVMGDGKHTIERVTVCTSQTLARALRTRSHREFFRTVECLIGDEIHGAGAEGFYRVMQSFPKAYWRVGLSATPFDRADNRSLMVAGCTGEVIYEVPYSEMVDAGVIAKPTISLHRTPVVPFAVGNVANKMQMGRLYNDAYLRVMQEPSRMDKVLVLVKKAAKPTIVLCEKIEHGEALVRMLRHAGYMTDFAQGELSTKQRDVLKEQIARGHREVVVANRIFKTGMDLPELRSIISVGAGKSTIANVQSVGRGSRRKDRTGAVVKDSFTVHDLADRDCGCRENTSDGRVVYAHTVCRWFDQHARKRHAAYRRAGFECEEAE